VERGNVRGSEVVARWARKKDEEERMGKGCGCKGARTRIQERKWRNER
jgi:hypothetical protein